MIVTKTLCDICKTEILNKCRGRVSITGYKTATGNSGYKKKYEDVCKACSARIYKFFKVTLLLIDKEKG